jgi:hypothetical protein
MEEYQEQEEAQFFSDNRVENWREQTGRQKKKEEEEPEAEVGEKSYSMAVRFTISRFPVTLDVQGCGVP